MQRNLKYRLVLWKRYFETGYGLTGYIKYVIALFGLSSVNVTATLLLGFAYAGFCFLIGWLWFKYKLIEVDNEISNHFNLFTREMREMKQKITKHGIHHD